MVYFAILDLNTNTSGKIFLPLAFFCGYQLFRQADKSSVFEGEEEIGVGGDEAVEDG